MCSATRRRLRCRIRLRCRKREPRQRCGKIAFQLRDALRLRLRCAPLAAERRGTTDALALFIQGRAQGCPDGRVSGEHGNCHAGVDEMLLTHPVELLAPRFHLLFRLTRGHAKRRYFLAGQSRCALNVRGERDSRFLRDVFANVRQFLQIHCLTLNHQL